MTIIIPAFLIAGGIALGTAIQATVVGLVRKREPVYLVFALTCFCISVVFFSSAAYHRAGSVEEAATTLRWMAGSIYAALPPFFLFVSLYTGRERARGFAVVALFFGALFTANALSSYSLRYSSLEWQPPLRLPWGEELAMYSGDLTAWAVMARLAMMVLFGWAMWRAAVQYRSGQHRQAILLGIYLALQMTGFVYGGLIEAGSVRSVYLGPFIFLLLVLFMSVSMGIDLRDQNLQVARLAVEWRETFDSVRTPILVTDKDGIVVRANRSACELSSIPGRTISGTSIEALGDGEPWQTAIQLVHHMAGQRGATSAEAKDDRGHTWDLTIALFSSAEQEVERFILVLWDISGIVELQEALRRSETMSTMGALLAGVAHEVRNPLFGISATLDAYGEELDKPEYAPCSAALRTEVERLKRLMQELLDYGKPGALKIETGSVADVVRQAMASRSTRDSAVQVVSTVSASLPPLLMDRDRLCQVFENLIDNAVQHSPQHGVVSTQASLVEHAGRTWIECTVQDNGRGFDPEDVDRAFEPFYSKRQGGTGLGLSIVQRIVEEHSGRVVAGNAPGGGAMIRVRLPVADA
jgi:signal transduction histidine kinase